MARETVVVVIPSRDRLLVPERRSLLDELETLNIAVSETQYGRAAEVALAQRFWVS
ncbi:hypothetical protein ACFL2Q_16850 [Thermodesulfobacteriota bacterium]